MSRGGCSQPGPETGSAFLIVPEAPVWPPFGGDEESLVPGCPGAPRTTDSSNRRGPGHVIHTALSPQTCCPALALEFAICLWGLGILIYERQ